MSLFNDVIELIAATVTQNNMGASIEIPSYREVYANRKGVRQTEFYQAQALGLRPELMFDIHAVDYQDEQNLRHDGREYHIIRTYQKGQDVLEIVCQGIDHG